MNREEDFERKRNSADNGSLTFTTRSADHATDACEAIAAPASRNSRSSNPLAAPAPSSTTTSVPDSRRARTANGVMATRFSPGFVSRGTPMRIVRHTPAVM